MDLLWKHQPAELNELLDRINAGRKDPVTRATLQTQLTRLEAKGWLKHLGEEWTGLSRQPGAGKMSLEEASLTAWVKYYRPDENSPNSAVSYDQKGELVALCLDLALRRAGGPRPVPAPTKAPLRRRPLTPGGGRSR